MKRWIAKKRGISQIFAVILMVCLTFPSIASSVSEEVAEDKVYLNSIGPQFQKNDVDGKTFSKSDDSSTEEGRLSESGENMPISHENSTQENQENNSLYADIMKTYGASGEKNFTVKKVMDGKEEHVGDFDTFYDALDKIPQNDKGHQYVVYVNRDVEIPENEGC